MVDEFPVRRVVDTFGVSPSGVIFSAVSTSARSCSRSTGFCTKSNAPAFKAVVTGKEIRQADLTEKIAVFESYGVVGGAGAVERVRGAGAGRTLGIGASSDLELGRSRFGDPDHLDDG